MIRDNRQLLASFLTPSDIPQPTQPEQNVNLEESEGLQSSQRDQSEEEEEVTDD